MTTPTNLDEIEAINITYSDEDAGNDGHLKHRELGTPDDEIEMFIGALPRSGKILDVGCGYARYVHRFVESGLKYLGIDHSTKTIELAKSVCPEEHFRQMSFRKMDFEDNSFDGLWCCCSLSNEPKHNLPRVLDELKRVLKPGGVMMIIMPDYQTSVDTWRKNNSGEPVLYVSLYLPDEFTHVLEEAQLMVVDSIIFPACGAMSFLVQN